MIDLKVARSLLVNGWQIIIYKSFQGECSEASEIKSTINPISGYTIYLSLTDTQLQPQHR